MRALHRKLLRDVARLRGQLVAISLVVASGTAALVTMRSMYESLLASREDYYARYRFADVFAHLTRASAPAAARLATLPGVAAVQPRIVLDAPIDVPGLGEPATGRLISIPVTTPPALNALHLRRGRLPAPGARDEVLVNEAFADANRVDIGTTIAAVIDGRWRRLRIVGVALSPEYIYALGPGSLFPDDRRFGVLWMADDALAATFGMRGAFNDVAIALAPGASERDVIARVDTMLAPYGGTGAYGRGEQISNRFVSDEIAQNRVTSVILPIIFLGVAAYLLNVALSRVVRLQRAQIAVMKAFGYGDRAVGAHYLELALVAIVPGTALGLAVGALLGRALARFYTHFYHFPVLRYGVGAGVIGTALLVSAAAALFGALGAVRRALALPPAEAMRPEAPARYHTGLAERVGMRRVLGPMGRMVVRNVERRPVHAALSVLGIALAAAIMVVGLSMFDAIRRIGELQFGSIQREDATVLFAHPLSPRAASSLSAMPGVLRAEPFRAVPVRIIFGHHTRRTTIIGLDTGAVLRRIVDGDGRIAQPPSGSVLLTEQLARILGAARGDLVTLELLEGTRPTRILPVAGIENELVGTAIYTDAATLDRIADGAAVSGAHLMVDPAAERTLYARLERLPVVTGIGIRRAARASFDHTISESVGVSTSALVFFASVIAVGIVFNGARVALSEHRRELASLRVLGFTRGETAVVLLGEQALLTAVALPIGCLLGYAIDVALARAFATELYRLPVVVTAASYVGGAAVVALAALLSSLAVRRQVASLDLVSVLKTTE